MSRSFDFENLFVYDLANNHQGDLDHARRIVGEVGRVNREAKVKGALKFQFRQLDSFIHPDFKGRSDHKYVKRFSETRLETKAFAELANHVRAQGLLTMCTPFDEESVDVICDMGLDIIKIASCSADDRPLLEKVARVNKPVVVSTAGLRTDEIDWLVNFLETERVDFALMHCVALYPTPDDKLQLNQIAGLCERYRNVPIGWSTHEDQNNTSAVQIAYALGARLFERHVGLATEKYKLNAYSSTPEQLERWIAAFHGARAMIGNEERSPTSPAERQTLVELKRGTYARRALAKGETVQRADVFFAMPVQEGQLISGQWRPGLVADRDYAANAPLDSGLGGQGLTNEQLVYQIMLQVRGMLSKANIHINEDSAIEISHHYGLRRFREFGAVIVTCINRAYAKKLVIQLPRQKHPYHFHNQKEETFQLLDGDLEIVKDGAKTKLRPGDTFLVEPSQWHKFATLEGCIFEEVSTTHFNNDSFYEDPAIARMTRDDRKTKVDNWLAYFRTRHAL
ncbi:MAG: N-acetylneuraminate synthase family protein [Rhizobiales bacterium]|nr:N-acetylneuraminate synthase family protein [Hyphomicrobiales bacterium]MBI3672212.1 N-acetylneuraminate synthase family protein [Hyphomicrobiales bacterium]